MDFNENVAPTDSTLPGERYRIRLKLYGPYDIQHVNTITSLIRNASAIQPWWQIVDVEASSDDRTGGIVPYASQVSEHYSVYVTADRIGSTPKTAGGFAASPAIVPAVVTVAVAVGLILALLTGFVVVVGWQAEKLSSVGGATLFNPLFLAAAVVIVYLIFRKG